MEASVRGFFERYESLFNKALADAVEMNEVSALYASEFIAASPAGVSAGKNNDQLQKVVAQGYARYRAMGMKEVRRRSVGVSPIDDHHWVAHVGWTGSYARVGQPDVLVDFDVHYLIQELDGNLTVFGWVSADEEALLREKGII